MQERPSWLPEDVDLEKPSAARCYDYFLGGAHNFASDRELGRQTEQRVPIIRDIAQNNRAFLRRLVRYCLDRGVRQFLDIGSGIPTVGNVHELVQQVDPTIPVIYVDNEPVAVAHSLTMLEGNDYATILHADFNDGEAILDAPETQRLFDFSQPIAVMAVALLHFVPDSQQPKETIHRLYERLAPGSYFGLSEAASEPHPDLSAPVVEMYAKTTNPLVLRSRDEIGELLSDFELQEPGIVYVPEWHPEAPEDVPEDPSTSLIWGGLGRKV